MAVFERKAVIAGVRSIVRTIPLLWKVYGFYWWVRTWLERWHNYNQEHTIIDFGASKEPDLDLPTSQLCTANQFLSRPYKYWCAEMDTPPRFARKQWEYVFILQVLSSRGAIFEGSRGLGFGCGSEPLPGVFAKNGCSIVATDLQREEAREKGWIETGQHSNDLDEMYAACNEIVGKDVFSRNVAFKNVDMNVIPGDLIGFDFVWSACALEHLGSLKHGMEFIKNSVKCLKPGGIAVHTTEFNLSSNDDTLESEGCSVYRKKDIEHLVSELDAEGVKVAPLNLNPGNSRVDRYVDLPPYVDTPHLKLKLEQYVITSIGLVVKNLE